MAKVLPAVFSYEDMKRRWNQDNPDEPYGRDDNLQNGIYAIENWLIRVDDEDNAIATGGWKEYPTHTVVGGLYAVKRADRNHPNYDPKLKGNARAIQDARESQLNQSKPVIASFAQKRGDNARWIATAKKTQKFVFSDDPEWEQAISALPKEVVKEWTEKSGNRWGIRNILTADELAKCIYPDDPTPSWFNLLKYLPDNTWDDFELGEPAPDLGTRDRFKDKNIKSRAKSEYKAFVSQQYLRQVSDRIPNAGTSLMKGWLEKLTEMNLKKGKYWFFGTNVKQDNTYVMIDVIKQGDPYTANADKKLNLEGFETAIIFTGVSKEMVGKVKRGQGIPKGRKFLDIHGKYGVRGLRRGRRLPKEPKNIFPTFEKSWKDILKVLPPDSWTDYAYREVDDASNAKNAKEINIGDTKYVARGHYITAVYGRNNHGTTNRNTDDFEKWINCVKGLGKGKYWMYANDSPNQRHMIFIDIIGQGDKFPGSAYGKEVNRSVTNDEGKPVKKVVIFTNYYSYAPKAGKFNLADRKRIDCYPGIKLKRGHENISGRFVEVDPNEKLEEQSAPTVSREELVEKAKQKINKILQSELDFSLPIGHIKSMIENTIKTNRKRKIYIGKNQRKEVEEALKVIYQ